MKEHNQYGPYNIFIWGQILFHLFVEVDAYGCLQNKLKSQTV